MDEAAIKHSEQQANAGLNALKQGRRDEARLCFGRALEHLEGVKDQARKRREVGIMALLFSGARFNDLALMAAEDAVEMDEESGNRSHLAEDLLTRGSAHESLGDAAAAEQDFQRSLQICLEDGSYANAASASTNLAGCVWNRGQKGEAVMLLKKSLRYLEQEAFPDTEINTRIALIQMLDAEQQEPELAIETARTLMQRFSKQLRKEQADVALGALRPIVQRYLQAHPEINGRAWKARTFPGVPL